MFSEENKIPEQCLKLERWQGPPHINTMKQYKLCFPLRSVCLFSDEDEQFDLVIILFWQRKIHISYPKLRTAPLIHFLQSRLASRC